MKNPQNTYRLTKIRRLSDTDSHKLNIRSKVHLSDPERKPIDILDPDRKYFPVDPSNALLGKRPSSVFPDYRISSILFITKP